MSELIWKLRYALYMNKVSKCGICFGWYCAGAAVESWPDWIDEHPHDMAWEEMSCWDNNE